MPVPKVLTDSDLAVINRTLQGCSDWSCVVAKMREAGYPTEDLETQLAWQRDVMTKTKAAFFPDQP